MLIRAQTYNSGAVRGCPDPGRSLPLARVQRRANESLGEMEEMNFGAQRELVSEESNPLTLTSRFDRSAYRSDFFLSFAGDTLRFSHWILQLSKLFPLNATSNFRRSFIVPCYNRKCSGRINCLARVVFNYARTVWGASENIVVVLRSVRSV